MVRKPNFVIIGAPKYGTTAMSEYLRSHPNVFMSNPKETGFFSKDVVPSHYQTIKEYLSHLALYDEDREAVFWQDAAECASHCHRLLANEPLWREIACRRHERALRNNLYNERMLASILNELGK
jgi:hypothetical protein